MIKAIKGGAYLGGADLRGADLGGAYLDGATIFGRDRLTYEQWMEMFRKECFAYEVQPGLIMM